MDGVSFRGWLEGDGIVFKSTRIYQDDIIQLIAPKKRKINVPFRIHKITKIAVCCDFFGTIIVKIIHMTATIKINTHSVDFTLGSVCPKEIMITKSDIISNKIL
jgi:hypothetical protein